VTLLFAAGVASPLAASVVGTILAMENTRERRRYGTDPVDHLDSLASRRNPHVATQQGLGLLA
jgi:hypothetical protein